MKHHTLNYNLLGVLSTAPYGQHEYLSKRVVNISLSLTFQNLCLLLDRCAVWDILIRFELTLLL